MMIVTLNKERYDGYVRTCFKEEDADARYAALSKAIGDLAAKFAGNGSADFAVEFGDTGDEPMVLSVREPAGLRVDSRSIACSEEFKGVLDEEYVRDCYGTLLALVDAVCADSLLNLEVNVNALAFGPISRVPVREVLTRLVDPEDFTRVLRAALTPTRFNDFLRRPAVGRCLVHDVDLEREVVRLTLNYNRRAVKVRELKEALTRLMPGGLVFGFRGYPAKPWKAVRVTLGRAKVVAPSSCLYGEGIKRPAEDLAS